MDPIHQLDDWREFYRLHFDLDIAVPLSLPSIRSDFDRLIVIPPGLTLRLVMRRMHERFAVYSYYDIYGVSPDNVVSDNDRAACGQHAYAVWVRDNVEADEQFADLSAIDLHKQGVKGITLLERLVFELKYFIHTGKHLDVENVTSCSGSRHPDGCVPTVYWSSMLGRVYIHWYIPTRRTRQLRCREVIA